MRRKLDWILLALVCTVIAAGCGGGDSAKKVKVREFTISLPSGSVKAGKVKFAVKNEGTLVHEFVVIRTPDPSAPLPTNPDGSVDEEKIPAGDNVGEIEDIAVSGEKSNTFDLTPGIYLVFCNVVDEGPPLVSHYAKGMHTRLNVTS